MPTRKTGPKRVKNTRKNKRGGGGSKSMSMKSLTGTLKDIFGDKMMKLTGSRKQPMRATRVKVEALLKGKKDEEEEIKRIADLKREEKRRHKERMDELAGMMEEKLHM